MNHLINEVVNNELVSPICSQWIYEISDTQEQSIINRSQCFFTQQSSRRIYTHQQKNDLYKADKKYGIKCWFGQEAIPSYSLYDDLLSRNPVLWCRVIEENIHHFWTMKKAQKESDSLLDQQQLIILIQCLSKHIESLVVRYPNISFLYLLASFWDDGRYAARQILIHAILAAYTSSIVANSCSSAHWIMTSILTNHEYASHMEDMLKKDGRLDNITRIKVSHHSMCAADWVRICGWPVYAQWIEGHHEHSNGQGYPYGLTERAIKNESRLLFLIERLASLIRYRGQRRGFTWHEACDYLIKEQRSISYHDETLARQWVNMLPVYPAGMLVELNNKEIAMVLENQNDIRHVSVRVLLNYNKFPYKESQFEQRDTSRFVFKIAEGRHWGDYPALVHIHNSETFWHYDNKQSFYEAQQAFLLDSRDT